MLTGTTGAAEPLDTDAYIEQVRAYGQDFEQTLSDRVYHFGATMQRGSLPFTIQRARALLDWYESGGLTQALGSAGAISQRVARAERAGYVRRGRSTADGRGVYVELTETGHTEVERTVDDLLRHEETLLSALTPAQRTQLAGLLRILLANVTLPETASGS